MKLPTLRSLGMRGHARTGAESEVPSSDSSTGDPMKILPVVGAIVIGGFVMLAAVVARAIYVEAGPAPAKTGARRARA